ncbi:hypothetical protein ABXV22_08090 [Vibrio rotiferianus]|uniref:hypothetical protein n=1 Tax=Vibrio rotiferianus TaxID=190895 RepID=UPI00339937FB
MQLYKMEPDGTSQNVVVDFGKKNALISDELIYGENDDFANSYVPLIGKSQISNFHEVYSQADFLYGVISVPIFSEKAKSVLDSFECFSFYEIIIDGVRGFYLCKIESEEEIIDAELSKYILLTDGRETLSSPAYKKPSNTFLITRDIKHRSHYLVSDSFLSICRENRLKIKFKKIDVGKSNSFFD